VETLRKQVRRARRRLVLQAFTGNWAWCSFVALVLATLAIGGIKVWPPADERAWELGLLAVSLGAATLAAAVWTWLGAENLQQAALELDRRCGLKERVSSALALDAQQLQTPAGAALAHDAGRRIEAIDVADHFGVRPDRRALLPLAPAAVALGLALLVNNGRGPLAPAAAATAESAKVKKSAQSLAKKLDAGRKQAQQHGLTDADALLKQLEQGTQVLADKTQPDRKQTLVALNELVKDAEKRRQQLAGSDELKRQLNQLKHLQQGPADKLGQALKNGDLSQAIAEIDKLKQELAGDKLDAKTKEQLAQQIDQMQQSLSKIVQEHEQAKQVLSERIEAQRRAGNLAEADKLEQQLANLALRAPQMDKFGQMAQQFKAASKCISQGQCERASKALDQLSENLSDLENDSEELEMLDGALDQIADAKSAMACKACNGEGCRECQGKDGNPLRVNRFGKGFGRGAGQTEEKLKDTGFYDSQVKQTVGKGPLVVTGLADGPNRKGRAQEEIKGQFSRAQQYAEDVLFGQRLPHDYRDHAKAYFDALREGQR
jgi:hypothetical protein